MSDPYDEKQKHRIALAEFLGWNTNKEALGSVYIYRDATGKMRPMLPNIDDLNVLHEAWLRLSETQKVLFHDYLCVCVAEGNEMSLKTGLFANWIRVHICGATARQRAEALLRTIGKWK